MLVKTHISQHTNHGFVSLYDGDRLVKVTTYKMVSDDPQVVAKVMDKEVAILRKLTGAIVVAHRRSCDRLHTPYMIGASCNLNLDPFVIARKEEVALIEAASKRSEKLRYV